MKNRSIGRIDMLVAWVIAVAVALMAGNRKPTLAQAIRTRNYHL